MGEWRISNKYYKAHYLIKEENKETVGQVLYYNDGTTFYKFEGGEKRYTFQNLIKKDSLFVDGVTGATSASDDSNLSIKIVNETKLEVKKSVMNQKVTEYWYKHK